MKKRVWLFLLLILVLSVFAACNDGEKGNAASTDGTTEAPLTDTPETEAPYVDARPAIELPADAASLDALVLSIDGATIENEEKLDLAYLAYCALSETEKAKVTTYELLAALRSNLTKEYVVKEYSDSRIPHHKLLLGVYYSGLTEEHMKQIADCHVDFTWGGGNTLDDHLKYGLGFFGRLSTVGLPYMWEGNEDDYRALIADIAVKDHPALWAIDCIDEPGVPRFAAIDVMGQVVQKELLPEVGYFANLFPAYGSSGQWEIGTYKQYIMAYINRIESDVICYDHYFIDHCTPERHHFSYTLENFSLVAEMCRKSGRDHYVILQTSFGDTILPGDRMDMTEDMLKIQAYAAMAHGVKSISWACWREGIWGWTSAPLNEAGGTSNTYYALQSTNADLKALEPVYMRYSWTTSAVHCGKNSPQADVLPNYAKQNGIDQLEQEVLVDLTFTDEDAVVIGHFKKNVGEGDAFMFVGCNDVYFVEDETVTVTFKTVDPAAIVTAYVKGVATVLDPDENGTYTVEIHNADAVFVTVD